MSKKVIFHIDVNSAFLSWEAVHRIHHHHGTLDLRQVPSAVGGDISKRHGIILAKSILAKKYGIQTGEPVVAAKRKCPDLVLVPPNYELYEKCSKAFMDILRKYSPLVEQYSIDEAFVDMSGMETIFGDPVLIAHRIKDEIYSQLGFSVNVGVSSNKLLAKMASDFKKPDRVHTLFPEEIEKKMWPLSIGNLFFVGRATEKKLHTMGIKTIGELAKTDINLLRPILKKHGEVVWNFANGRDVSAVEEQPMPNKGYGNSTTISFDVMDAETAKTVLLSLSETVARRLRKDQVSVKVVSVGIRFSDLTYSSHQMVLDHQTNITKEIYMAACRLFDELWDQTPIRHLGIHTSRVSDDDGIRQLSLFDIGENRFEKHQKLDHAIDDIRSKYGKDAVQRASFLNRGTIDHMSGGISREKRKVDYNIEKVE